MKKMLSFVPSLLVLVFLILLTAALVFPYYGYYLLVQKKWCPVWYSCQDYHMSLLAGKSDTLLEKQYDIESDAHFWKSFHVGDYKIPLPVEHPEIRVQPLIYYQENKINDQVQFGFKFLSPTHQFLNEVKFRPMRVFERFPESSFFGPIFFLLKSKLEVISIEKIWIDLFSKEVKSYEDFKDVFQLSYQEIFYNLYLWSLRNYYFGENAFEFYFDTQFQVGVLDLSPPTLNEDHRYRLWRERLLILHDNYIYSMTLKTQAYDGAAEKIRNKILSEIKYTPSLKEQVRIYQDSFQHLDWSAKVSTEGMFYLFSAWSHDFQNQDLLRNIIKFLERGEENLMQLGPFYDYALSRYGKDFLQEKLQEKKEKIPATHSMPPAEAKDDKSKNVNKSVLEFD